MLQMDHIGEKSFESRKLKVSSFSGSFHRSSTVTRKRKKISLQARILADNHSGVEHFSTSKKRGVGGGGLSHVTAKPLYPDSCYSHCPFTAELAAGTGPVSDLQSRHIAHLFAHCYHYDDYDYYNRYF